METDKQFFELFQANPGFAKSLFHLDFEPVSFATNSIKKVERSADGLFIDASGTHALILEFQGYNASTSGKDTYASTIAAMALYHMNHKGVQVEGAILFLDPKFDTRTQPWVQIVECQLPWFRVYYLNDLLRDLAQRNPQDLLLDIFWPMITEDHELIRTQARDRYQRIAAAPYASTTIKSALDVFFSWLASRLKDREEASMLVEFVPFEQTMVAEVIREKAEKVGERRGELRGELRGERRGKLLGEIKMLHQLYQAGVIPEEIYHPQLEQLQRRLKESDLQQQNT